MESNATKLERAYERGIILGYVHENLSLKAWCNLVVKRYNKVNPEAEISIHGLSYEEIEKLFLSLGII